MIPQPTPLSNAARSRIAIHTSVTIVFGFLLTSMLFSTFDNRLTATLGFTLLLLVSIWRLGSMAVVLFILAYMLVLEPRYGLLEDPVRVCSIAFCGLMLTISICRLRALLFCHELTTLGSWFRGVRNIASSQNRNADSSPTKHWNELWSVARPVGSIAGCIAAAIVILSLVPSRRQALYEVGLQPTGMRVIQIAFVLAVTYVMVCFVIRQMSWRTMAPSQAAVYLRSSLVGWLLPDLRSFSRRAIRLRKRARKIKNRSTKTSPVQNN